MLNVGDKVFVPSYGAGYIDKVEDKTINEGIRSYINILIPTDSISIYIPVARIHVYKIRNISDRNQMEDALSIIKEEPLSIEKKWSQRYRKNGIQ